MEQYIGEIRAFGFTFAPIGWAQCNGQLMSIAEYSALYAIIGTTYGGNGQTNFALPNLQGQIPMHWGNGPAGFITQIGEVLGSPAVTLTVGQIPQHSHDITAVTVNSANERIALPDATAFLSGSRPPSNRAWQNPATMLDTPFSQRAIGVAGGSTPHENMQPYLTFNFCIALEGVFPSQS